MTYAIRTPTTVAYTNRNTLSDRYTYIYFFFWCLIQKLRRGLLRKILVATVVPTTLYGGPINAPEIG